MKTLFLILVLPLNLWGQETDKALDAKINLSGGVESRHLGDGIRPGRLGTGNFIGPANPMQLNTQNEYVAPVLSGSSAPPAQSLPGKEGDASCPRRTTVSRVSNGSDSVQPAIAACPHRVKAPVDAGLLGKIIVPYDNSLFLRSDLPYFLGDSYVPRSSLERAQYQIVP